MCIFAENYMDAYKILQLMNRLLLLKICLLISASSLLWLNGSAQEYYYEDEGDDIYEQPRNELKFNTTSIIFDSHPELAYEHLFNSGISLGTRLGFSFDKDFNNSYRNQFQAMPYLRWNYLSGSRYRRNYNRGYFYGLNINMSFFTEHSDDSDLFPSKTDPFLLVGGGIEWGYKYITRGNWVLEFAVVAGRYTSNPLFRNYKRLSLMIGKTF